MHVQYKEEVEELHTHTHSTVQYMQWTAEEHIHITSAYLHKHKSGT